MPELLKSGTSIKHQRPLETDTKTTHSTLIVMEDPTTSALAAPTQIGGKYSSLMVITSSTFKMVKHLMLREEKTLKVNQSGSGRDTMARIRDGQFNMSIRWLRILQQKTKASR